MSWGSDLSSGFNATSSLVMEAKRHKQQSEMAKARQVLEEDRLIQDANDQRANRSAGRQNQIEQNNRFLAGQRADQEKAAAFANDPREQYAKAKAILDLESMQNPAPPSEAATLETEIAKLKLKKELDGLTNPQAPAAPKAKIRQPIGPKGSGGYAEFEANVDQVPNLAAASAAPAYKSPYGRRITDLDKVIATEQTAIEGGDRRKGLINMTSREDIVRNAQSEKLKLFALELQDKVRAGVITQEEADAEADQLLSGSR